MSTWEERMAERAAGRALVREAEDVTQWAAEEAAELEAAAPAEAAYIERVVGRLTTEDVAAVDDLVACACVGAPPGCARCYCTLLLAAVELWRERRA